MKTYVFANNYVIASNVCKDIEVNFRDTQNVFIVTGADTGARLLGRQLQVGDQVFSVNVLGADDFPQRAWEDFQRLLHRSYLTVGRNGYLESEIADD